MRQRKRTTVTITDPETGDDVEIELPTFWDICSDCGGEGSHSNRNIDGNGITASEWADDWDEEERETYLSGGYDVRCKLCDGTGKVLVVDETGLSDEVLQALDERARADADDRYTRRMEGGSN